MVDHGGCGWGVGDGSFAPLLPAGPNDASNPGGEANLDIQAIMGVARNVSTTFWSIYANTSAGAWGTAWWRVLPTVWARVRARVLVEVWI